MVKTLARKKQTQDKLLPINRWHACVVTSCGELEKTRRTKPTRLRKTCEEEIPTHQGSMLAPNLTGTNRINTEPK